jgi:hypothetical protein
MLHTRSLSVPIRLTAMAHLFFSPKNPEFKINPEESHLCKSDVNFKDSRRIKRLIVHTLSTQFLFCKHWSSISWPCTSGFSSLIRSTWKQCKCWGFMCENWMLFPGIIRKVIL